ncbi:hypothetical protein JMJ35_005134 [Cladonia borealis]|uniref:Uncharacterized protein n=1 Tax=Cladonia borealis TaxID=184061 RepID=A0AA39UA26_9LECA|nr:hypothetical protein JMJ35_005134 [Cladonia borealis]
MVVGLLYRWEEHNHGLEHKCGTCHTVLSSPRAKKTCFGIHEEVCTRYHKTLFFVGQSHHCEACHTTVELHDKRHRQIASIVQSIQSLDRVHVSVIPLHSKKKRDKRRKRWDESDADAELKDSTQEGGVEWDDQSSTLNEEEADDKQQYWTAETRKAAKAERKAAKNQARFNVITQADMENVQRSLHPELEKSAEEEKQTQNGQGLTDNKTIEDNIAFNNHTFKWGRLRQSIHQKKIIKANDSKNSAVPDLEAQNDFLDPILSILGIRVNVSKATKARKSLETKLRNAIMEDVLAFQNEQDEKMQRMAGYWRYVNRRTYNEMVKNNELWDWATGQKLPEIEEDNELESIQEEDEENYMSGATYVGTPNGWSLECSDNETDVEGSPLVLKTSIGPDDDDLETPAQQTSTDHDPEDELLEYARERMENLSIPKLKASLHSPTPSIASNPETQFPSTNENDTPLPPNPPFQGKKDTRTPLQAIHILPPSPSPSPSLLLPTPTSYRIPSPTTILPANTTDLGNRYRNLKNELPAPCDEVKPKAKPKTESTPTRKTESTSLKTAVLVIKKWDVEGEEGWEIKGGKSKRAVFPKLGTGKGKAKGKAGMGMDFVGAARRGIV